MGIERTKQAAYLNGLYEKFQQQLIIFFHQRLHNWHVAEELMQETFIKAYLALDRFEETNVRSWLYTIAHHILLDYLRANRLKDDHTLPIEETAIIPDVAEIVISSLTIQQALRSLQPEQQQCIVRYSLAGYSQLEDAARQGLKYKTMTERTYRARNAFKSAYKRAAG